MAEQPVSSRRGRQVEWSALADAVAGASFRVDERATDGFSSAPASAAAAGVLDAAIEAVEQRRRNSTNGSTDVPLDGVVFDRQALRDLVEFLRHSRRGLLTAGEIVQEAAMWQQIVAAGWPIDARDAPIVTRAVDLLAAVPAAVEGPPAPTPATPANDLERAMAAVVADEGARPDLWRSLHDGDVVLPVVDYELVRPEGAHFRFLAVPYGDTPLVLGFATEERLDALLRPGQPMSRVLPPGKDLPKIWPAGHWLMINPGYANSVVLSPWEMRGLPDGPLSELPHPRAVQLETPEEDDARLPLLVDAVASLAAAGRVWWARVRPRRAPSHAAWQDVLVVAAHSGEDEADESAALQSLSTALPPDVFPQAVIVGREAGLGHPFVEAAVRIARVVRA